MDLALRVIPILIGLGGLYFGYSQWSLRRAEKEAKRIHDEQRRHDEQRPPDIYNASGQEGPLRIGGFEGASGRRWGCVTIVNPTGRPIKLGPERLVLNDVEISLKGNGAFYFSTTDDRSRYERLSIRAGDKADYNLNFVFPLQQTPTEASGELWLRSDNCPEPFSIPLKFT